ncbi:21846_t:CDS:2, partial [Cetraspora pellucida]
MPLYKLLKIYENLIWKKKQQKRIIQQIENASHLALGTVLSQPNDNRLEDDVDTKINVGWRFSEAMLAKAE